MKIKNLNLPGGEAIYLTHKDADQFHSEWKNVIPGNVQSAHPSRRRDWLTSRIALKNAFQVAGVDLNPSDFNQADHHSLANVKEWIFSLSHSDQGALVWIIPTQTHVMIGVDLEIRSRVISEKVEKRFTASDDIKIQPIDLWSIKEAVYKNLDTVVQRKTKSSDIIIGKNTFRTSNISGHWLQQEMADQIVTFAWRKS